MIELRGVRNCRLGVSRLIANSCSSRQGSAIPSSNQSYNFCLLRNLSIVVTVI